MRTEWYKGRETHMSVATVMREMKRTNSSWSLREGAGHVLQWRLRRPNLSLGPVKAEKKNVP